ncbi:MAG TPA: adenosine deaminase [Candidatus Acidoferrales bacterium]|nr:adenosine deaminase [Candidatus Acidoferrales bacterium]
MTPSDLDAALAALPKAELHLHLEGSMAPETVVRLAARYGVAVEAAEVAQRYCSRDFAGFLDAFRWVTSFLRAPEDYRLVAGELIRRLSEQNVVYAEITLSAGVMLRRGQDVAENLGAVRDAARQASARGLRVQWILDAVRQFGPEAAMEAARWAVRLAGEDVVAFGIGGDELAIPAREFAPVFDFVRAAGLHALAHAGEIGGPEIVREALDRLSPARIGHGLGALHDPGLMDRLAGEGLPLEICPTSNLRTGALARQLGAGRAGLDRHPLKLFFDRGLRVTLSTDDPAMFETDLTAEYRAAAVSMGFAPAELARLAEMSFECALLPESDRSAYRQRFRREASAAGLL